MSRTLTCLCFVLFSVQAYSQIDSVGSGRAMRFDGVDDMINLGNIYDDLVFPFTISSWVYFPPGTDGGPVFVSQDNNPVYNGFWFSVRPAQISIEYGDGLGENQSNYRRGKSASFPATIGRWMNVCGVVIGVNNIQLFINGVNAGGSIGGGSSLPMASQFPNDVAKIGYFLSNGVTYRFNGVLDDIRIFNRALTVAEIQRNMTRKSGKSEPGLIGYWTFDEISGNTLVDRSTKQLNGVVSGNPNRIFSGAPIGNENNYRYTNSWSGVGVSLNDQTIEGITGSPSGIHLYKVNGMPSQTLGMGSTIVTEYYGVFIADNDVGHHFSLANPNSCEFYKRLDNSVSTWVTSPQLTGINDRIEYFPGVDVADAFDLDLGVNKNICNTQTHLIETALADPSGKTFEWSTGETSPSIQVTQSGRYTVTVKGTCIIKKDSVTISFMETPPAFSLGADQVICQMTPKILTSGLTGEFNFRWQNGSTEKNCTATEYGKFWLTVENPCGWFTDSVRFSKPKDIPFVLELGDEVVLCDEQSYLIETGLTGSEGKTFSWNTGATSQSLLTTQSGIYSVTVQAACNSKKDSVSISFLETPPAFSLGEDEIVCLLQPRTLVSPVTGSFNFRWQDNSDGQDFTVARPGKYWLTVENACGTFTDTLNLDKPKQQIDIANVITPNDDLFNEYFVVERDVDTPLSFSVYNRWGKMVFQSANYKNNWNGSDLPSGVYFYTLTGACFDERRGSLSVLK